MGFRITMNTGFMRIEPGIDIGVDLGEESWTVDQVKLIVACFRQTLNTPLQPSGWRRDPL
ncbi:MAG: hypothetical protein KBA97_06855 [Methanothrix sp.]|nr:hypothetical protein [Methanothrix sp.]